MALIPCPECGRVISSQAHACPSCGYPIAGNAGSSPLSPAVVRPELVSSDEIDPARFVLDDEVPCEEPLAAQDGSDLAPTTEDTRGLAKLPNASDHPTAESKRPAGGCMLFIAASALASLICGAAYKSAVAHFLDKGQPLPAFDFAMQIAGGGAAIFVITGVPIWIGGLVRRASTGRFVSRGLLITWIFLMIVFGIISFFGTKMRYDFVGR